MIFSQSTVFDISLGDSILSDMIGLLSKEVVIETLCFWRELNIFNESDSIFKGDALFWNINMKGYLATQAFVVI